MPAIRRVGKFRIVIAEQVVLHAPTRLDLPAQAQVQVRCGVTLKSSLANSAEFHMCALVASDS